MSGPISFVVALQSSHSMPSGSLSHQRLAPFAEDAALGITPAIGFLRSLFAKHDRNSLLAALDLGAGLTARMKLAALELSHDLGARH